MSDREKRLEALRIVDRHMSGDETYEGAWINYPDKPEESPASVVREAIADDAAGGGDEKPPHERPRLEPKYSGVIDTSPQHREAGDALQEILSDEDAMLGVADRAAKRQEEMMGGRREVLEALERIKSRWVEACDGHEASLQAMRADVEAVRRHLTAPTTVPEAVRRLPEALRSKARVARSHADNLDGMDAEHAVFASRADAHDEDADALDRALAQHSEPGRVPDGWKLTRHDEWISIGSPDGRVVQIWKGPDMISDVIYRMLEAMLAAPAPDADERE